MYHEVSDMLQEFDRSGSFVLSEESTGETGKVIKVPTVEIGVSHPMVKLLMGREAAAAAASKKGPEHVFWKKLLRVAAWKAEGPSIGVEGEQKMTEDAEEKDEEVLPFHFDGDGTKPVFALVFTFLYRRDGGKPSPSEVRLSIRPDGQLPREKEAVVGVKPTVKDDYVSIFLGDNHGYLLAGSDIGHAVLQPSPGEVRIGVALFMEGHKYCSIPAVARDREFRSSKQSQSMRTQSYVRRYWDAYHEDILLNATKAGYMPGGKGGK